MGGLGHCRVTTWEGWDSPDKLPGLPKVCRDISSPSTQHDPALTPPPTLGHWEAPPSPPVPLSSGPSPHFSPLPWLSQQQNPVAKYSSPTTLHKPQDIDPSHDISQSCPS